MSKPLLSCGPHIEKPWKDSLGHRTVTGNLLGSAFRIEVNISHTRFEAELSGLSENTTPASLAKTLGVVRVVVVVLVLVLVVAAGRVVTIGALPTRTADGSIRLMASLHWQWRPRWRAAPSMNRGGATAEEDRHVAAQ